MMNYYTRLLTYIKSAVTRNYSEKSINSILDYISTSKKVFSPVGSRCDLSVHLYNLSYSTRSYLSTEFGQKQEGLFTQLLSVEILHSIL